MMLVGELAEALGADIIAADSGADTAEAIARSTRVCDVEHDSRQVQPGALFACIRGVSHDGHDHAHSAVDAGAAALLVQRRLGVRVPQLRVDSVRRAVGPAAAAVYGHPSRRLDVVGVTGTDGKTTTAAMIAHLLRDNGRAVTEIGTLTGSRTTPEAPELQRQLRQAADRGDDAAVIEVSSHALDQHRVLGCEFRLAVFTNLGRDHLDHHRTMEHYFQAKSRLFEPDLAGQAVINTRAGAGHRMAEHARSRGLEVLGVDDDAAEVVKETISGCQLRWRGFQVRLPVIGDFNAENAVLAAEAAVAMGMAPSRAAARLAEMPQAKGRFEPVDQGQDFAVVIDYAHTPQGLTAALSAARRLTDQRVIVVFGAGGDRDRGKRPAMGAAAASGADWIVVTSDNPRSERPEAIISEIVSGMSREPDVIEADRRRAVQHAVEEAERGDIVVIAGKGHETTQIIGDRTEPYDERIVARQALNRLIGQRAQAGKKARSGKQAQAGKAARADKQAQAASRGVR